MIQAILPVTNSVTAPYIGFNVTPVARGFITNCPQAPDTMDESDTDPFSNDYHLQSTENQSIYLGHDGMNSFQPLIASLPNTSRSKN